MIEAYNEKYKQNLMSNYNLACMIAGFISKGFAGKDVPDFYELYPSIQKSEEEIAKEDALANSVYATQFAAFAQQYNAQRKETH